MEHRTPYRGQYALIFTLMHQSIPSTNIPPGLTPREFFKVVKFPAPGQKMFCEITAPGQKIDKNPAPGDNFVDLQDNFAMILKPFAFFWYSSLAWLLRVFSKTIKLANTKFLSDSSIAQLRFDMYGRINVCLLLLLNTFTRWDFMKMTDNIFYICSG